ncbi:hypothetical protein FA95DRAFT_1582851 [Auriscalpium vulgare]|uniref:Uncharacterized protein n=1 Tax=Auriscalpium vulgare TaxID=40419 RepID=A0ACB8RSV6_9AGAM|nr:hypothetical protein FA95DRAFT_1582851 [Auriscalpium vulgare]
MPTQQLTLTTTNMRNLVIANKSDVIYYEIVTPRWEKDVTRISRKDPNTRAFNVVGELRNEFERPVAVRMYGGEFRPVEDFLGRPSGEDAFLKGKFQGKDGRSYIWRVKGRHLELVQEDNSGNTPVAVFHPHKRYLFVLRMSRHPYLEIDASMLDALDSVIISFILIQHRRRDGCK